MGKKIFAILMIAVVATFAGYNIFQSQRTAAMSDLMLANVEALARGESSTDDCVYDPSSSCILLHPTDSDQDDEKPQRRW